MRYYLDTNILIFVLIQDYDSISRDVEHILRDPSNRLYVSSVAVRELIHSYKTGDIKDADIQSAKDLFYNIEASDIEIVPMNKHHLLKYAELESVSGHKDPNDHIIIAQAMADKIPIISSDIFFKLTVGRYNRNFVRHCLRYNDVVVGVFMSGYRF
jgi:PIN domain nuclease of toxin-antitoxin system